MHTCRLFAFGPCSIPPFTMDRARWPSKRTLFHSGGKACFGDRRCSRNHCKTARPQILRRAPLPQSSQHRFHQQHIPPNQTRKVRHSLVRLSHCRTPPPASKGLRALLAAMQLGSPVLRHWNSFHSLRKFWQEMGRRPGQSSRYRCAPLRCAPPFVSLRSPSR